MNLYFRLIILLVRAGFMKKDPRIKPWKRHYRCMPWDCDINIHMTNARYNGIQDLSRTYALAEMGILFSLFKQGFLPVLSAQEITYFKPIGPFQKFTVITTLGHWDEKYYYISHEFYKGKALCARSMIRGVFVQKGATVPTETILKQAAIHVPGTSPNAVVLAWKELIEAKKRQSN